MGDAARYSQVDTIPNTGVLALGSIGGDAYRKDPQTLLPWQLGLHIPPRTGLLWVHQLSPGPVANLRVELKAYDNYPIVARAPGRVVTELPANVIIRGEPGTVVQVMCWELSSPGADRGAAMSARRNGEDLAVTIPPWASAFDFEGVTDGAVCTFRDAAANIVGIASGRHLHTNFSLPDGAATATLTGADGFIVFRQNG